MSAPVENANVKAAVSAEDVPESPTTARPLEMDDDDMQETGVLAIDDTSETAAASGITKSTGGTASATAAAPSTSAATATDTPAATQAESELPPPKPPRPQTEAQQSEQILKEAFPTVEPPVIKAVLSASGGRIDAAFNALLEMTDPEAAARHELPPPPPPRPAYAPPGPTATTREQLEADELYARQLAEEYDGPSAYEARTSSRGDWPPRQQRFGQGTEPQDYERERNFIDDDLPVIRDNLRKGFIETQSKVNSWFNNLKKRIDDGFAENDEEEEEAHAAAARRQQGGGFMGRPTREQQSRRSAEYDRYDADPELLSDDFAGMKFKSDGTPLTARPPTNPNLFKPPPPSKSPKPSDSRKVAFSETVDDIDRYSVSPKLLPKDASSTAAPAGGASTGPGSSSKQSKWQPLSMVDPNPIAENDPFSLGDSDDERDSHPAAAATSKDNKPAGGGSVTTAADPKGGNSSSEAKTEDPESERLRKAAAEAMADSLVDDKAVTGDKKV